LCWGSLITWWLFTIFYILTSLCAVHAYLYANLTLSFPFSCIFVLSFLYCCTSCNFSISLYPVQFLSLLCDSFLYFVSCSISFYSLHPVQFFSTLCTLCNAFLFFAPCAILTWRRTRTILVNLFLTL